MNVISPKTMWFIILLVALCSFFIFDHEYLYIPHVVSRIIFFVCTLSWFVIICFSFFVHREAYKNAYAISHVVHEGIYKYLPHPMYLADILLFFGIAVLFPMMWVWVAAFFGILMFWWFMNIEESVLRERFPVALPVETIPQPLRKTKPRKSKIQKEQVEEKPKRTRKKKGE